MKLVTVAAVLGVAVLAAAGAFGRQMGRFLAVDVAVACQLLAEAIVRVASRRMPRSHRDRYQSEWLAELDALREERQNEAALSLVLFAVRILARTRRTARAVGMTRPAPVPPAPDLRPPENGPDDDLLDYLKRDPRAVNLDDMLDYFKPRGINLDDVLDEAARYEYLSTLKHEHLRRYFHEQLNRKAVVHRIRVVDRDELGKNDEGEAGADA